MAKQEAPDVAEIFRDWIRQRGRHGQTLVVAIDPGTTGAVGFLIGQHALSVDIPTYEEEVTKTKTLSEKERKATGKKTKSKVGIRTKFSHEPICQLFVAVREVMEAGRAVYVVLEDVPPSLGPGRRMAEALLNRAWAMWPLFLHAMGFSFHEVAPAVWKKAMGLLGKDKKVSLAKARAMFPSARECLLREKDHNRAESLIIAEYARRTWKF